jgi:uncharacterized protein YozE (UPF0346 family)
MSKEGKISMKKSFYLYVLTFRGGDWSDPKVRFAEEMFNEHNFPKQSTDFDELSTYIESFATDNLTTGMFDELWSLYVDQG